MDSNQIRAIEIAFNVLSSTSINNTAGGKIPKYEFDILYNAAYTALIDANIPEELINIFSDICGCMAPRED